MLDNGSTAEDVLAYETLAHYDIPIAVVDHHHPDPEAVEHLLDAHVNPTSTTRTTGSRRGCVVSNSPE